MSNLKGQNSLCLQLQEVEMITMLGDILWHLRQGDVTDSVLSSLEAIVSKLLMHYKDLTEVLNVVSSTTLLWSLNGVLIVLHHCCHDLGSKAATACD